jgi:hypothetical protein
MISGKDSSSSVLSRWSRKYSPFQFTAKISCVLGSRGPGQRRPQSEGWAGPGCLTNLCPTPSDVVTRECGDFKEPGKEQRPLQACVVHHLLMHSQWCSSRLSVWGLQRDPGVTSTTQLP